MIAPANSIRPGRPNANRIRAIDSALETLSRAQDAQAVRGLQKCFSQMDIAKQCGLTRSRVEQLECSAKLNFLQKLALKYPQSFLDLGGNFAQLTFLQSARITSTNTRSLWRQWTKLSNESHDPEQINDHHCSKMN